MSDLTVFRDHARAMSTAEHKPECRKPSTDMPACGGCNPAADRALFTRLADEIDAYLTVDTQPTLC